MFESKFTDTFYTLMEQKELHSLTIGSEAYGRNNNNELVQLNYSYTPEKIKYILTAICAENSLMIAKEYPLNEVLIDNNYRLTASLVPTPTFTLTRENIEQNYH